MKVFVLEMRVPYEQGDIIGIYHNLEFATELQTTLQSKESEGSGTDYIITEYSVRSKNDESLCVKCHHEDSQHDQDDKGECLDVFCFCDGMESP